MEKTIIIHLNQIVFNIEEQAYEKLSDYLDSIRKHYKNTSDADEIVSDIEASAADHFTQALGKTKQVITLEDVEKLISNMGSANDISQDDPDSDEKNDDSESDSRPVRKLFRDPQNKVLGGVISGIASYLNFDVTLLRIITAVLLLIPPIGGSAVILYLILWAIVPEAKTAVDKIVMKGEEVNLSSLENEISSKNKKTKHQKNGFSRLVEFPIEVIRQIASFSLRVVKKIVPIILITTGLSIIVGCATGIAALVTIFINYFFDIGNSPFMATMPQGTTPTLFYLFSGSIFIVSIIPIIAVMILGVSLIRRKQSFRLGSSLFMFCIWLSALVTLVSVSIKIYPDLKNVRFNDVHIGESRVDRSLPQVTSPEQKLKYFDSVSILGIDNVNIISSTEYKYVITGNQSDIDNSKLEVKDNSLSIKSQDNSYPLPITIDIYVPFVKSISVLGQTNLNINKIKTVNLALSAAGNSVITASGTAENLTVTTAGESTVNAKDLIVKNGKISTIGQSKVVVNASSSLNISALGESIVEHVGIPKITSSILGDSIVRQYAQ